MKCYSEAALKESLKAAREKVPGAEEAWKLRVEIALKDQKDVRGKAAVLRVSRDDEEEPRWVSGIQDTGARLAAIAEADAQAFEALKEEQKRLVTIEHIWRAQLEMEERAPFLNRLIAVKRYYLEGDFSAWNALSHQEREAYNEAVIAANESMMDVASAKIQEIKANVLNFKRNNIAAIKAKLAQINAEEEKRKIAIRWAKMHDFSCKAQQEECRERSAHRGTENNQSRAVALVRSKIAQASWSEARKFEGDLTIPWERKMEVVQTGYNLIAEYSKQAAEAWNQLAKAKRVTLAHISLEDPNHQKLMETATTDLIRAEKEKHVWLGKGAQAENNAEAVFNPQVLDIKNAFAEMRMAWKEVTEMIILRAQIRRRMMEDLSSDGDWSRMRDVSQIKKMIRLDRDIHFDVMLKGIRMTSLTDLLALNESHGMRAAIHAAQETTETAARESADTIWAADTAWCLDALREADELVTAITGVLSASDAEEEGEARAISEAETKTEKK